MELKSKKMVKLVQLVLLLVCLVSIAPHVSAKPAKVHHSQVRLMDHLFGRAAVASRTRHSANHQHQRRSADSDQYYDDYKRVQQCYENEDVNELCQRCSKVTKSSMVFPMCCNNEDETRTWCQEYVYYGIQT